MSRERQGKVIHVDKLTIHAKEVEIINERSRGRHDRRRNPWDFFGPRRREDRNELEREHHEESEDRHKEESGDRDRDRDRRPRWI